MALHDGRLHEKNEWIAGHTKRGILAGAVIQGDGGEGPSRGVYGDTARALRVRCRPAYR